MNLSFSSDLQPLVSQYGFGVEQLFDRLAGMTDEEYLWEPVAGCWSIRPRTEAQSNAQVGDAIEYFRQASSQWQSALESAGDEHIHEVGYSQLPWGLDPQLPFIEIAWWVNKELIHHAAEVALLRDLYRARQ